jgi:hypothetical protein
VRRLIALVLCAGCASAALPPGGPTDREPPRVVSVTPDSGTTSVRARNVEFTFDDVVNDRLSRGTLDQYFLISPRDGAPRVSWHRRAIEVRPRRGFRPNTAYTVTKLPGLTDLEGNRDTTTVSTLFSTGPTIPAFGILGRIFDWAAERPAAGAIVEAVSSDSTVYIAVSDTSGGYTLGPFGQGTYSVRGYIDANHNLALDRGEKWDSTQITITTVRQFVNLSAIERDTIPPAVQTVAQIDSLAMTVTFNRPIDPTQTIAPALFRVLASDSTPLLVVRTLTQTQLRAAEDSAARVSADSVRRADSLRAVAAGRPPAPGGTGGRVAPTAIRPPSPAPPTTVELRLSPRTPLRPGRSYRVTALAVRGITGRSAPSSRVLQIPRPDSTARAPRDSAQARPPATRPPHE